MARRTLFTMESATLLPEGTLDNVTNVHIDNGLQDPTQVSEVTVAAIEDDIQHLDSEITREVQVYEANEEALTNLQDTVAEQEQVIQETPEQVTEDNIQVAQECLAHSLGKLGINYKTFQVQRLSVETHKNFPVDKLKITLEGIKEVIANIIERIKAVFRRIAEFFKELYYKAVMYFDKSAAKAEALKKVYVKGKVKQQLSQEIVDYAVNNCPIIIFFPEEAIRATNELIIAAPNLFTNIVGKIVRFKEGGQNLAQEVYDIIRKVQGKEVSYFTKLHDRNTSNGEKVDPFYTYDYTFNNKYVKTLLWNKDTKVLTTSTSNVLATQEGKQSQWPVKVKQGLNDKTINQALDYVITNIKNNKQYVETLKKAREQASAQLDVIKAKKDPTDDDKISLQFISKLGGQVALDTISAYIKWNKFLVNLAEMCLDRSTVDVSLAK